jgi:hypothetical protein
MDFFKQFLKFGMVSEETYISELAPKTQQTANTAETLQFDLPPDQGIAGIDLTNKKDTDGTLVDNIKEVRLTLDGVKTFKKLTGPMLKALSILALNPCDTGHYVIPILDDKIKSDPIPGNNSFNSIVLEIDVAAAGASTKNVITPTLTRVTSKGYSFPAAPKILVEKYNKKWQFGTLTGNQEVLHDRAWTSYGYLLQLADNDVLSDTAFDKYTLELINSNVDKTLINAVSLAKIKQMNKQMTNGVALPTGLFYIPFPDGLKVKDYTTVRSLIHNTSAGTNIQAQVLERVTLN